MLFCAKKVVLVVLSSNNFITKPIKTKQNVKHIIRKPEQFGGMLVYRLTNNWHLVLFTFQNFTYLWYDTSTRITITPMHLVYLRCTSKCSATERHGWVLGFARKFGEGQRIVHLRIE